MEELITRIKMVFAQLGEQLQGAMENVDTSQAFLNVVNVVLPVACGILRIAAVVVAILIIARCLLSLFREKPGKEIWGWLAMNDGTRLDLCHWENTVGRGRWADVDLNFPTVSRSHIALLRDAQGAFAQMDWLLNALLKLSRLDAGIVTFQKAPVEVAALVQTALRPFLIPLELHDIRLTLDLPQGVHILGDQAWLAEALGNVLKNCVEKAGEHGALHIACEDTLLYTAITLHDSGEGIAPEDLPFLFERFYRGKDAGATGYGIGLALSKTILTRQGATITAKNHPQGGALFVIRFSKPLER